MSPAGSHKPNTAVAQAYYNKKEGVTRITTETGAGQWGSALAMACQFFGLQCKVYMVKVSYHQKPYRRVMMETWGAQVVASPSPDTQAGKKILEQDPDSPGSLGIAISEAVEDAAMREDTKYSLGSVLNHVLVHQTVIGLEAKKQLEKADDEADIVIGCAGGGSNFAGLAFPFAGDKLTQAQEDADHRRRADRLPEPHQGAVRLRLRRHGGHDAAREDAHPRPHLHPGAAARRRAPLPRHGAARLQALRREASSRRWRCRSSPPSRPPSSSRGRRASSPLPSRRMPIRVAIDEALACKTDGRGKAILFNLSGHGAFDLAAYEAYLAGKLQDYEYPSEKVQEALRHLPSVKA